MEWMDFCGCTNRMEWISYALIEWQSGDYNLSEGVRRVKEHIAPLKFNSNPFHVRMRAILISCFKFCHELNESFS